METISSRDNRRLVHARKVRDGKDRSQIFIEGVRLAYEALRSDIKLEECYTDERFRNDDLLTAVSDKGIPISYLKTSIFRTLTATENPQGVALLAQRPANQVRLGASESPLPFFLYLHEANNPSNLGAILRSLEAAGAGGAFISRNSADVFSPKALRGSMGSAFRVPLTTGADLDDVVAQSLHEGLEILALEASAKTSYLEVDWSRPHLLVCGSEAHGLASTDLEKIGQSISIPMANAVESLNLAVAAGVVLFEARRQCLQMVTDL